MRNALNADMENVLLLFDEENPCWTRPMLSLANEEAADALLREGFLLREGEILFLAPEGVERFRALREESFLSLRPGVSGPEMDREREARRSLLRMFLDKRHLQRWGLKEYNKPFLFDVPNLDEEELFSIDGGELVWRYQESAVFVKMARDFPHTGMAARAYPAPDIARISGWMTSFMPKRRTVTTDLLYRSRYDFRAYARFPKLPADPCDMLNTDRFFCFFTPPPLPENERTMLKTLGEFQMYMTMLRRMYMPGYVDRDSLDQDGVNWLIYIHERETDAVGCAELLSRRGRSLDGPAAPLEIWSLSLQALLEHEETSETIHDLLPDVAHPILRLA
jgi:hypothetical protein